jgi:hypothetical protein
MGCDWGGWAIGANDDSIHLEPMQKGLGGGEESVLWWDFLSQPKKTLNSKKHMAKLQKQIMAKFMEITSW